MRDRSEERHPYSAPGQASCSFPRRRTAVAGHWGSRRRQSRCCGAIERNRPSADSSSARPGRSRPRHRAGRWRAVPAGLRLHDLRHAYATALLSAGVHPKVASEALGHSSVSFTMDTYQYLMSTMQDAATRAIEEALGGAIGGTVAEGPDKT
jgi:integrase